MISFAYENMDAKFDAVLKTLFGKTIEIGRGQFNPADRSVDFECDFIPLFSMGTKLQLLRLHEGTEVHRFVGEVYFSSAGRLRLVSVQDEVLPEAALVFLYYVELSGTAQTTVQTEHRGLFHTDLSVELDPEQPVTVSLSQGPAIARLPMVVKQSIVFGQEANCYRCRLLALHASDETLLKSYILQLSATDTPKSL